MQRLGPPGVGVSSGFGYKFIILLQSCYLVLRDTGQVNGTVLYGMNELREVQKLVACVSRRE